MTKVQATNLRWAYEIPANKKRPIIYFERYLFTDGRRTQQSLEEMPMPLVGRFSHIHKYMQHSGMPYFQMDWMVPYNNI